MTDNVNHPAHYETGKFECIEVMLETQGIANVESMKNAKTAVEYLEKLGFDLSALIEADNHPVTTALTVEVDTKFLFIGGEKK